jgi:HEAT repeat protein
VRAGALLALCQHPQKEVFLDRAREALADPSPLVRIAAAGTLAYHGDRRGEAILIEALEHPRWEIRWWCGKSLTYLGGAGAIVALERREAAETDPWVKREIADMLDAIR